MFYVFDYGSKPTLVQLFCEVICCQNNWNVSPDVAGRPAPAVPQQ